jgi:hypothetical protein
MRRARRQPIRNEWAEIRADPGLGWEKQERKIKALSTEHYARVRELEALERAS